MLWMDKYKPEEKAEDATDDSRMEAGTEVGKLARELFGKPVDVTETVNGQLNLPAMTDRTQVEIEHETSVICEASFSHKVAYFFQCFHDKLSFFLNTYFCGCKGNETSGKWLSRKQKRLCPLRFVRDKGV